MSYPRIALASSSPRRRELLAQLGVDFQLVKADIDETSYPNEAPELYVTRLARQKALAGGGERRRMGAAVKQLDADPVFQRADLMGHRRRSD